MKNSFAIYGFLEALNIFGNAILIYLGFQLDRLELIDLSREIHSFFFRNNLILLVGLLAVDLGVYLYAKLHR